MRSRPPSHASVGDLALFSADELLDPAEAGASAPIDTAELAEIRASLAEPIPLTGDGDLIGLMRQLWAEQQRFERVRAERLGTDRIGLATLDLLLNLGPQPPSVLAVHAGCSNAVMTLSLNRLESRGHIVRGTHPIDQRKILVLLADGVPELVEALTAPRDARMNAIIAGMGKRATQNAAAFLTHMVEAHRG